ncbi:MAG: hypothetical protein HDQ88_07025 [Clostridia bacterium]|nr:hypothetical protein [Clostridia bacterium]
MRKLSDAQRRVLQDVKDRKVMRFYTGMDTEPEVVGAKKRTVEALVKKHLIITPPVAWIQTKNWYTITLLGEHILEQEVAA